ncbi:MAG: response regulator transcription factor [Clostridiales bacterium]|nr:response regulator transcription factor [Clostridiales bacterium]
MIRVMLADDQKELTEALKNVLETDSEIRVVGVAENGQMLLDLLKVVDVDLILMDVRMPVLNGVLATREVKLRYPHVCVLILTTFDDSEYILDAINYGANGYLLKDSLGTTLISSIKNAMRGDVILPMRVAKKIVSAATMVKNDKEIRLKQAFQFSDREAGIAIMLMEGFNNRQIASSLMLSEGTCRNYISAIYDKVGKTTRADAVEKMNAVLHADEGEPKNQ